MNREMKKPAERKKLANERRLCCATQQKVLKYEAERRRLTSRATVQKLLPNQTYVMLASLLYFKT